MQRRRVIPWRLVVIGLLCVDAIAVGGALLAAYWLRFDTKWLVYLEPRSPTFAAPFLSLGVLGCLVSLGANGLYRQRNVGNSLEEYRLVMSSSAAALLGTIVLLYIGAHPYVSRGFLVVGLVTVGLAVCVGRFIARRILRSLRSSGFYLHRVLIVGTDRQAVSVARQLVESESALTHVIGFLSEYEAVGTGVLPGLEVLGEPLQLAQVAQINDVDRAVVVESGLSWESLRGLVQDMHRDSPTQIMLVPGLVDLHATPMRTELIGPVLTLAPERWRIVGAEAIVKRTMDIGIAVPALAIAGPIMLGFWAWSRLNGRNSTTSGVYVAGTGKMVLRRFQTPSWARRAHLTRLPELIDVMAGRLAVIGPRPLPVRDLERYGDAAALLAAAKPGFIGPWWIVGRHRPPDADEELSYDIYYLRNYSTWLDLQILLRALTSLRLWGSTSRRGGALPSLAWTPRADYPAIRRGAPPPS